MRKKMQVGGGGGELRGGGWEGGKVVECLHVLLYVLHIWTVVTRGT